jgi:hypothetical protein
MDQDDEFYYLNWGQAKYQKSVAYDPLTNVPILYTAASLRTYRAFATTFKALKAPFSNRLRFSNSQGTGAPLMSPTLYLKSL